jgi:hypothetical protein
MRFFLSPLIFIAGILIMKYSVAITDQFTGKIELAEKYLSGGLGAGTYTWWKLFGLAACILSVLWLFNMLPHSAAIPTSETTSMIIKILV